MAILAKAKTFFHLLTHPGLLFYKLHSSIHLPPRLKRARDAIVRVSGDSAAQMRIIDVGCGLGELSEAARELGIKYAGIEVSEESLASCQKRYGQGGQVTFLLGSAEELPLQAESTDLVILNGVAHHLDDEQLRSFYQSITSARGLIILDHDKQMRRGSFLTFMQRLIQQMDKGKHVRELALFDEVLGHHFVSEERFTIKIAGFPLWPYFCRTYLF